MRTPKPSPESRTNDSGGTTTRSVPMQRAKPSLVQPASVTQGMPVTSPVVSLLSPLRRRRATD